MSVFEKVNMRTQRVIKNFYLPRIMYIKLIRFLSGISYIKCRNFKL